MIHNSGTYFNRLLLCANVWVVHGLLGLSLAAAFRARSSHLCRALHSLCAVRGPSGSPAPPPCRRADCAWQAWDRRCRLTPGERARPGAGSTWKGPYHRCRRPTRPSRVPGSRTSSESPRTFKTPSGMSPSLVCSSARNLYRLRACRLNILAYCV